MSDKKYNPVEVIDQVKQLQSFCDANGIDNLLERLHFLDRLETLMLAYYPKEYESVCDSMIEEEERDAQEDHENANY